ncbi:MAG: ABC-type dipeptide/oligopeptide/nickel transport system, permease component [Acidimicrobiales bacterium]|nr:ABC-type dipeptide/oligopeptide/nickel transport system, permease component [Acidimicrobiales bacterium]
MTSYILRRMLQLVFVLWGGATILFLLFFILPGSPAELIAGGGHKAVDPQVVKNIEHQLGIDRPIYVQYVKFLDRTVHGDLGESYLTHQKVTTIIKERAPLSLRLAFWAIVVEVVIGISSGVLSARRRNSLADTVTTVVAVVASAVPVFVLGYLIKQVTGVYAYQHQWPSWARFPPLGFGPNTWYLGIIPSRLQLKSLLQPALVLASVSTAILARITRTSMLETLRMDHVRTARAKGLKESVVIRKHVLRNAMLPVITILGIDFGTAVGAAVLTETVFNLRGLGYRIVTASAQRDVPIVLGLSLVVMFVYGIASVMVDVGYALLDPRIRLRDSDA